MDTAARITLVRQLLHAVYLPLLRESGETAEAQILREDSGSGARCQFSERFLQAVWNEQRLRAPLHTVDGRPLSVVTPGTWNLGPGPDFSQATLLLAGTPVTGDVEIHHAVGDWHQHGHDRDPLYRNVVLHVVWQARPEDLRPELPPCLSLRELIDRPWPILSGELQMDDYPYARQVAPGGCARELAAQPDDRLRLLLQVAGLARFAEKSNRLRRDIVAKGADQTLHEAFFDALGYRANRLPFRRLAEAVPAREIEAMAADGTELEAALFGTAGLLPDPARGTLPVAGRELAKQLWDAWWRQGRTPVPLAWKRAGQRPFNRPERRLAAACLLLHRWRGRPAEWLLTTATESPTALELRRRLRTGFAVAGDGLLGLSRKLVREGRLLGDSRVSDIVANVILPFLRAWAVHNRDPRLERLSEEAFLGLPRLQENRLLIQAVHRFLIPPSRARDVVRTCCEQQGLLDLYRNFCLVPGRCCASCRLARAWALASEPVAG